MKAFTASLALWVGFIQSSMATPMEVVERSIEELDQRDDMGGSNFMKPIRLFHEKRKTGLNGLDSRNQDSFLYGADDGTSTLANMTLVMDDGRPLVSMERFEGLTRRVDCDETMSLEFVSKEAFEYAIHAWGWVNENADDSFVMIANHEGCGPTQERVPYSITDVDYDEEIYIAYLTGTEMKWTDIKATLILDYGQVPTGALSRRDWNDVTKDVSVSIDMEKSLGASTNLWSSSVGGLELNLDCLDCGTSGSFEISGRVKASLGFGIDLEELWVQAKPNNLEARLELELSASGTVKDYNANKQLLSVALPGSISIPKIFKLGATLDYDVGLDATVEGTASLTYGVIAKLSNAAVLKVDLRSPEKSEFSGWSPDFEQIPMTATAEVEGRLAVYSQPGVSLGIKVLDKWGYEVALRMKLPEIAATLSAKTDADGGLCGVEGNYAALDVDVSIGVDLSFELGSYENSLYSISTPFYSKCFGFAGNGDGEGGGVSPAEKKKKGQEEKEAQEKEKEKEENEEKEKKAKEKAEKEKEAAEEKKQEYEEKKDKDEDSAPTKTTDQDDPDATPKAKDPEPSKKTGDDEDVGDAESTKTTTKDSEPTEGATEDDDDSSTVNPEGKSKDSEPSKKTEEETHTATQTDANADQAPTPEPKPSPKNPDPSKTHSGDEPTGTSASYESSITPEPTSSKICKPVKKKNPKVDKRENSPPDPVSDQDGEPEACEIPTSELSCNGPWTQTTATAIQSGKGSSPKDSKFTCGTHTRIIQFPNYPSPRDAQRNYLSGTVDMWYDFDNSKCDSWSVKRKDHFREGPENNVGTTYATEHVYEGQILKEYLKYLTTPDADKQMTCDELMDIFFNGHATNRPQSSMRINAVAQQIGSVTQPRGLVILQQQINGAKGKLFHEDKALISIKTFPGRGGFNHWLSRIRAAAGTIDYMNDEDIRDRLTTTRTQIEAELKKIDAKFPGYDFTAQHKNFFNFTIDRANDKLESNLTAVATAMLAKYPAELQQHNLLAYMTGVSAGAFQKIRSF